MVSNPSWFTRDIHPGMTGRDVVALQALLGAKQSGVLDDETLVLVRGVQRLAKQKQTGVVDESTARAVGERERAKESLPPVWFTGELGCGDHDPVVPVVRNILQVPPLHQPLFDCELCDAVKRFQGERGLKVTGRVDASTAVALGE